jgi:hypothetical protein
MVASSWIPGQFCHAQGTRGFDQVVEVYTTGDERNRQKDLWALEVQMKPVRLITVEITDPETGDARSEQIWYLVYRAINRPIGTQLEASETEPINTLDAIRQPPKFMPEFTLMVYDDPVEQISEQDQIYVDEILPEAVAAINRVEARRTSDPLLRNSVSIINDVPDAVAAGDPAEDWSYGVATWRGVDPDTDFFKVILSGFSNGYSIVEGPGGEDLYLRKVIVQEFTRLGDRFDPNLREFDFAAPAEWNYRPE